MVKTIFIQSQLDFIKENYQNMTYKEMSMLKEFNELTEKQIRNKARGMGLSKIRKFNDDYFKIIDTPTKAYWLGFIYADGYLSVNEEVGTYEFGVEIHTDDKYMLESLNKELGDCHSLTSREREISFNGYDYISKCSRLRVYSKKLCTDLIYNGIDIHKTDSSLFPKIIDNDLFINFIRGFLDGDGCIHKSNDKLKAIHFTNSSIEFLEYIQNRLLDFDVNTNLYKETDKKYKLHISVPDGLRFLEILYKNSDGLRLKRKFDIYKSL